MTTPDLDKLQRKIDALPSATGDEVKRTKERWANIPQLHDEALYGPIGHYVSALAPDTEASPAGILAAAITTMGAMLGRGPHCMIEGAPHHARFMMLLVGPTSAGRKGTALHHGCTRLIRAVDPAFLSRTVSGLSSGEGLIELVRDATPDGEGPGARGHPGVTDKRLLVKQGEAAGMFKVMERDGNSLSPRLREAWDGDDLQIMTRSAPMLATAPHICLAAAITPTEFLRSLKAVEVQNGLANRFTPFWCEKENQLPFGGGSESWEIKASLNELKVALDRSRRMGLVGWAPDGRDWWAHHYALLATPQVAGVLGALLARGAPIVQRLALLFAVLDGENTRSRVHCEAAHAVWRYIEGTWRAIYSSADALSDRAQKLLAALNAAGAAGIQKAECRGHLGSGNIAAEDVAAALGELREAGLARPHRLAGKGRPAELWVSTQYLSGDGRDGQNHEGTDFPTISTTDEEAST